VNTGAVLKGLTTRGVVKRVNLEEAIWGAPPMKREPSPFLFEEGKQRENLRGSL